MQTQRHSTTARQRCGQDNLRALFDALPDSELLEALQRTRWTGRPGYPIRVMWRTLVASFYMGIVHDTDLIRALHSNPTLAAACGVRGRKGIPSKFAYCRFRRKLTAFNDLVGKVLAQCVERLREALPEFGSTIAVDATDVKAWANGYHQDTDPDAGTGAKKKSQRRVYWYGYKLHLAADADSELPVWFTLTPANVYDGAQLAPVLKEAQARYGWFRPTNVLADKGYDARETFRFIGEDLRAIPVVDVQKRRVGRPKDDPRPCEAFPVLTPDGIRYRCNRVPYDAACPRFRKCPLLPMFVDSPLNQVEPPYFEPYSPFPYRSPKWQVLYNKRLSVERVFSRLKTYRKLDAIRTRRLPKVWLHVALSVLVMNVAAVVNAGNGLAELRRCVA
jgi:IS5 family transposase